MHGVGGVGVRDRFFDAAFQSAVTRRWWAVRILWPFVPFAAFSFRATFIWAAVFFRVAWAIVVEREVRFVFVVVTMFVAAFLCGIARTVRVIIVGVIFATL